MVWALEFWILYLAFGILCFKVDGSGFTI